MHSGVLAFRTPNQGLEIRFCCWIAGQGLAQKECFFTDTGIAWYGVVTPHHVLACVHALYAACMHFTSMPHRAPTIVSHAARPGAPSAETLPKAQSPERFSPGGAGLDPEQRLLDAQHVFVQLLVQRGYVVHLRDKINGRCS